MRRVLCVLLGHRWEKVAHCARGVDYECARCERHQCVVDLSYQRSELLRVYSELSPFGQEILLHVANKYLAGEKEHGRADLSPITLEDWLNHMIDEMADQMVYPFLIKSLYDLSKTPKKVRNG